MYANAKMHSRLVFVFVFVFVFVCVCGSGFFSYARERDLSATQIIHIRFQTKGKFIENG